MDVYAIPITDNPGKYIIYRPLRQLAFVGNRAMAEITLALTDDVTSPKPRVDQKVLNFLVSIGFMAPDPFSPVLLDGQFSPTLAVLLLTNQCQLRCTYCYAAAGESVREQLSPDLGYAAIDYVYQNACAQGREGFDVSFHGGGEPTFAWTTLKQCTQYARQKSLKSHITLTSNGVWSSQQTAWIIDNIDGLSLSVDGMPETQDRQRPLRSGRGSSPFVKRTIAELDRHDFPYGLRLTATHPWTLADDVRFLCEETKCQAMQVEPAFNESRGGHGEPDDEDITGFVEEFLEAHSIAEAAGRTLFYSGARFGLVTTMFCTAPYNALIVNANGDLVACYEVASDNHPLSAMSVIGRVKDGEVVPDEAAHRRLHDLMAERRADCRDCFCYWSCAGDCYARAFGPEPGDHLRRKGRCTINQRLMERLILRHIAKSEGVWQGAVYSAPAPTPHEACNIPAQNVSVQNTTSASHA